MAKTNGNRREMERLLEQVRDAGWDVSRTRSLHWRIVSPDVMVPVIFTSGTPSDWRSVRNFKAQLKRCGLKL